MCTSLFLSLGCSILAQSPETVRFNVDAGVEGNPISPLIYGINSFSTSGLLSDEFLYRRLGGNRTSTYNWENNASNGGADWHHQNDGHLSASAEPAAAVLDPMRVTLGKGGYVLVTVPMGDRLAADKLGDGDIAKTPDFVTTRLVANHPTRGTPFPVEPDLSDHAVYQDEFVAYLKNKLPSAFKGEVARVMFSLDNEADLWHVTHPRLWGSAGEKAPLMPSQDFLERSEIYAKAIKAQAPNALVFGPASFGWYGMRNFQGGENGKGDFLDAYLKFMRDAEKREGRRLLDVLDVHWYPEDRAGGVRVTGRESSPAMQQARMNAPRSLWDRTFVEPSWIGQNEGAVQLIPRLKREISRNYPDTAIAFTEYNYGGPEDISGGIAEADVLGIFGREGLFAANHWPMDETWSYIYAGMAMYRNYDGKGGRFGNVSLPAVSDDMANTSVYASRDSSSPNRLVIVLINKNRQPITAELKIGGKALYRNAHLYALTGASSHPQDSGALAASGANLFAVPMPAFSVVTVVAQ
jgi:hypothetical protein